MLGFSSSPPPKKKPNCMISAAIEAKKLAMVMISTSRCFTCDSSCAITPSSSLGESHARLREIGLDAEPLDHPVQAGGLLGRDLLRAHRGQRELVREEQLGEA